MTAIRSGMMKEQGALFLPSASSILGKGFESTHLKLRSSIATSSFWRARSIRPIGSRADQRVRLATTSFEVTASPVWKRRPERSLNVQVRPSPETSSVSTICRCGTSFSSTP